MKCCCFKFCTIPIRMLWCRKPLTWLNMIKLPIKEDLRSCLQQNMLSCHHWTLHIVCVAFIVCERMLNSLWVLNNSRIIWRRFGIRSCAWSEDQSVSSLQNHFHLLAVSFMWLRTVPVLSKYPDFGLYFLMSRSGAISKLSFSLFRSFVWEMWTMAGLFNF
jgi:hypothetical protein